MCFVVKHDEDGETMLVVVGLKVWSLAMTGETWKWWDKN